MTGCERVLQRLRQGPATAAELYRLGVVLHSRVSDLRKRGYLIECERTCGLGPESYLYTLVGTLAEPSTEDATEVASPSGSASVPRRSPEGRPESPQSPADPQQLSILELVG